MKQFVGSILMIQAMTLLNLLEFRLIQIQANESSTSLLVVAGYDPMASHCNSFPSYYKLMKAPTTMTAMRRQLHQYSKDKDQRKVE